MTITITETMIIATIVYIWHLVVYLRIYNDAKRGTPYNPTELLRIKDARAKLDEIEETRAGAIWVYLGTMIFLYALSVATV